MLARRVQSGITKARPMSAGLPSIALGQRQRLLEEALRSVTVRLTPTPISVTSVRSERADAASPVT
jgi:hypothetical protein